MAKYTRINSNYVLRKKHKTLTGSQILERDWVTVGGFDRFAPGKRPYYRDGNFIFTTNSVPSSQKKHAYGKWVGEWTYDDVKDAVSDVNNVTVSQTSNDLRDFAYYGSCVEMVRASIENIINNFPSQITVSSNTISITPDTEYQLPNGTIEKTDESSFGEISGYYILNNSFNIDLYHTGVQYDKNLNMLRYLDYSYDKYTVSTTGTEGIYYDITSYDVCWDGGTNCNPLSYEEYYCSYQNKVVVTITINNSIKLYGYQIDNEIIIVSDNQLLVIRPNDKIIEKYFNSLKGFEKQLLVRSTEPLYKNSFLTPIEYSKGVKYVYRDYTWPSDGYQIIITSIPYTSFVNKLIDVASYWDETFCDNLYRSMTHEAIKNYDWTYTRQFADGEEEDYVNGGNRMTDTLRVIGAYFDDIKSYIDGIKVSSNATYNGFNNLPESLLSDKLELQGIVPYSIIPVIDGVAMNYVSLSDDFVNDSDDSSDIKWYSAFSTNEINAASMDNEFMRRMLINARHIMRAKGTKHSIDMIFGMFGFGEEDYTITEEYRTTTPKLFDDIGEIFYTINQNKDITRYYDDEDEFSGVPIKTVTLKTNDGNKDYVVPFIDSDKDYDGYIYFQSQGGWGNNNDDEYGIEYMETQSYLGVVPTVADLFEINPNKLKNNDIYYVLNISDILEYDENADLSSMSHMFYVTDTDFTQSYAGWRNINDVDDEEDEYIQKKAAYLENIISINISNNPHVGFGNYDCGETYFDYMSQPFKYSIDNGYLSSTYTLNAENNTYTINKHNGDKIIINSDEDAASTYYLNSKVLTITNNIDNELYKQYLEDVILKYIIQVIPSTTILILKNCIVDDLLDISDNGSDSNTDDSDGGPDTSDSNSDDSDGGVRQR